MVAEPGNIHGKVHLTVKLLCPSKSNKDRVYSGGFNSKNIGFLANRKLQSSKSIVSMKQMIQLDFFSHLICIDKALLNLNRMK